MVLIYAVLLYLMAFVSHRGYKEKDDFLGVSQSQWNAVLIMLLPSLIVFVKQVSIMTETEKIYKHTYFMIGETLVEESKQHITSEKACEQIREYLNEMCWKLNKEGEQK